METVHPMPESVRQMCVSLSSDHYDSAARSLQVCYPLATDRFPSSNGKAGAVRPLSEVLALAGRHFDKIQPGFTPETPLACSRAGYVEVVNSDNGIYDLSHTVDLPQRADPLKVREDIGRFVGASGRAAKAIEVDDRKRFGRFVAAAELHGSLDPRAAAVPEFLLGPQSGSPDMVTR